MAQVVKNMPSVQEVQVQSLGRKDPLEEDMATNSLQYSCLENPMDRGAWLLLVFRLLIWSLRSFHRPPLLSRLSASPPFVAASPLSSWTSPPRLASRSLSVSPRPALALLRCCVAGSVARGGWLGGWLSVVLRPLASRSLLAASLRAARSFRFFS